MKNKAAPRSTALYYLAVLVLAFLSAFLAYCIEGARETYELMRTAPHDGQAGLSALIGSASAAVVALFAVVLIGLAVVKTISSKRR